MTAIGTWLDALRLKTLPLALSCIFMGSSLAFYFGYFDATIMLLATLTTLFLQVLSNLANDYGDAQKGTDGEGRLGPLRAVQSGMITEKSMKLAVVLFALLSLASGITLLMVSFSSLSLAMWIFLGLGIGAIAAAIKYTVGDNAYGYRGLGDLFVLIFFGFIGVLGSFYLYAGLVFMSLFLPALAIGVFAMGVLNLNNLRDIDNDRASGKITIVVKYGASFSKKYHLFLLAVGWLSALLFSVIHFKHPVQLIYILSLPIFYKNAQKVMVYNNPKELIPSLKQLALGTFVFTLLFGLGLALTSFISQ
ncbi:MAG: 1,4-dihydroxy-2-naphthoate polyprenyltransferase [Flavobacteriales bacterium]|nr:1,4-dihydroxy-2-naphthoate polyprenyltransferase [Flavobacteriales bacterium]